MERLIPWLEEHEVPFFLVATAVTIVLTLSDM
jgi:hypothetical protein